MLVSLLLALPALPSALAWGAAGHEIVATIAQVHLRPDVRDKLCGILPPQANCHLAPIAAWADQVRMRYRGTGPMHYINGASLHCSRGVHEGRRSTVQDHSELMIVGKDDHPADTCLFGEHGWVDEDVNVLTAIMNMTAQVMDGRGCVTFLDCHVHCGMLVIAVKARRRAHADPE